VTTAIGGFGDHMAALAAGNHLRVVNYHATPASSAASLRRELAGLAARYDPVGLAELDAFFATGRWPTTRPGLLPVFYEGYRDGFDVVAPLLDEVGLTGWFFVCTGWVDTPPAQQEAYAYAHHLGLTAADVGRDRLAMSWDEIAALARRHVVTPHTASHDHALGMRSAADIEREVTGPKRRMDAVTGQSAPAFAWLHGTPLGLVPAADAALTGAGYRYLFSNTMVQRLDPPDGTRT